MFTEQELKIINNLLPSNKETRGIKEKIKDTLKHVEYYNLCLWNFFWDCGRQGNLEGVFKAPKEEVEKIIGYTVSFGEVLGKHSNVRGTIEVGDIQLLSDNPLSVMNASESGFNPLEYINDIDYFIDDLNKGQLIRFMRANDYQVDSDDIEDIKEAIHNRYKGSGSDELLYAREYALGLNE